ncbi:MAG: hypothetical protein RIS61_650 [Actinomycetota bacterium]
MVGLSGIAKKILDSKEIKAIVNQVHNCKKFTGSARVIAIDGPAGSGKTTLADELCNLLPNCEVVHMDDLYDGWIQELINELPLRIETQILKPLSLGNEVSFQTYDWHQGLFTNVQAIDHPEFLILEGVGAANPKLKEYFALRIWVEAQPALLLDRLIARDGQQLRDQLVTWQVHEAEYFERLDVRGSVDLGVRGD